MIIARQFVAILMLVAALALLLPNSASAVPDGWTKVGEGWSGSGSAFLPGGTYVGSPGEAGSECPGCRWEVTPICELSGPDSCQAIFGCPAGEPYALIFFIGSGGGDWTLNGGQCLEPGEPISTEELGSMASDLVRQSAPTAAPGFQPRGRTLTSLPTIFWAGQAESLNRSDVLAGVPVQLAAHASWSWSWGDGSRPLMTGQAGAPWPSMAVTHTFRRAGLHNVVLRSTWDASFWVNGVGPFPITGGPIVQETPTLVPVREARAVLVEK